MNERTVQKLTASFLSLSALLGVLIMVLDKILPNRFLFATGSTAAPISHVDALIGMIIVDVIVAALVLYRPRRGLMIAGIWGILQFIAMAADPILGPYYNMTVSAFASYLFGLPEFDARLIVQIPVIFFGWKGYAQLRKS
jgi:hypothetical protein